MNKNTESMYHKARCSQWACDCAPKAVTVERTVARGERETALRNTPEKELRESSVFTFDEISNELARRFTVPHSHR